MTDGNGNAWLGLEVDEAFIHLGGDKVRGETHSCLVCLPPFRKGLQLRLEFGNVVTGEGERGESGSWRLDG